MDLTLIPGNPLKGGAGLPGDKSLSHRAALFAALAEGESRIDNFLVSGVTRAMLEALTALGVLWELEAAVLRVRGKSLDGFRPESEGQAPVRIDSGNSATTLRLLAGALAASGTWALLDGSPGLRRRPMKRIVDPLLQMGVRIQSTDGCAPLLLEPPNSPLRPLTYELPVASAQVKSCLLLASLSASGTTTLYEPGPSRDHTERMLRGMGVDVTSSQGPNLNDQPSYITRLTPLHSRSLAPLRLSLPGDFSSAAFLIVAALVTPGSEITLDRVGLNPTRTGLLEALRGMGADIQVTRQSVQHDEPVGDLVVRHSRLGGVQVSGPLVVRMIDEFPVFAVAAAYARGRTVVAGAEELRHKESDRIAVLCDQLRRLDAKAEETPDGFIITGEGGLEGGTVDSCGDHRLAMALAVAGLASRSPVTVRDAEIMAESFPTFLRVLSSMGAQEAAREAEG